MPDGSPRIAPRVKAACEALVSGRAKTQEEAANQVGLSREHLNKSLAKPHVALHIELQARRKLAIAVGRAAAVAVELLEADSERVRQDAAQYILGLRGILPPETSPDHQDTPLSELSLAEIEQRIKALQGRIDGAKVIEAVPEAVTVDAVAVVPADEPSSGATE